MSANHFPILVIGAGAGGLVVAIGAAKAGKKVLLIEKGNFGGDCTNFGCIPSKSLIASAHAAHTIRHASDYGLHPTSTTVDGAGALQRTREIIQHFRGEEGPEGLAQYGVETLVGIASFVDAHTLHVKLPEGGSQQVSADQIVIATGSGPVIPPIGGLADTPYLTNETIFKLQEIPRRLGVVGGGAIGCELSQAFQRLGSQVSILEAAPTILIREEPETQELMQRVLKREGIEIYAGAAVETVQHDGRQFAVTLADKQQLPFDQLLIAVGRKPNIHKLNLDAAGVDYSRAGIPIDRYGRTSVSHIWAIGDATGLSMFTHVAEVHGRAVLTNLLIPGPFKLARDVKQAIPAVTYTDPEVAHIGLTEQEAKKQYGSHKLAIYHLPLTQIDRAVTAGKTDGFIKLIAKKWSGKLIGATICSQRAGEMLPELSLAMKEGIPLRKISGLIHAYPTYNHGLRRAADKWLTETILPTLKSWFSKG